MVLAQEGVHLFQEGGVLPPTGWLYKPLNRSHSRRANSGKITISKGGTPI